MSAGDSAGAWLAASGGLLRRLLHDLKQPLNHIRVVAQDVRIDLRRERLDLQGLAPSMQEIEASVDELVRGLDHLRCLYPAGGTGATALAGACTAAIERVSQDHPGREVAVELEEGLPPVGLDGSQLEHLLVSLLDAALRGDPAARTVLRARRVGPWAALAVSADTTSHGETFPLWPVGASMGAVVLVPMVEA